MTFSFATATRVVFGPGSARKVAKLAAGHGRRAFLVTGSAAARVQFLPDDLAREGLEVESFRAVGEPSIERVEAGVAQLRAASSQVVIAIGGGSAIDTGKAIAALASNEGAALSYLEVIGEGRALTAPPLPFLAVPTTAGTGAEVTKNAVLASATHRVKVSLRSDAMLPQAAVVDPELTVSVPPDLTAATGMDALTQLLESFVSHQANPLTDAFCRAGLRRVSWALRRVYAAGDDLEAREAMALASLLGGLALANAKLGAVHGFAGPIGGRSGAPHGAICAALVPPTTAANVAVLHTLDPHHPALERYHEAAQLLTGSPAAVAADGVTWLADLARDLGIPPLSAYGIRPDNLPELAKQSARSSSMRGNPVELSHDTLVGILEAAL